MRNLPHLAIGVFLVAVALPSASRAAEQLDITVCYSGTFTLFHDSKEVMGVSSWTHNGIIMSHSPSKLLDNAVVHCEGVQRGLGP